MYKQIKSNDNKSKHKIIIILLVMLFDIFIKIIKCNFYLDGLFILQTLRNSNFDMKSYKNYRIKKLLNYLPKKYIILNPKSLYIYPYHQTKYINQYEYD